MSAANAAPKKVTSSYAVGVKVCFSVALTVRKRLGVLGTRQNAENLMLKEVLVIRSYSNTYTVCLHMCGSAAEVGAV